jgi:outer membrane protein assembly factor BamB
MGYSIFGPVGLTHHVPGKTFDGYTVLTTLSGDTTYLVNMAGEVVHTWQTAAPLKPYYGYLLDNGNLLLRCTNGSERYGFGGASAAVLEMDWDGRVLWRHEDPRLHHDHARLRNGNTLVIGWEPLPEEVSSRVQGGVTREGQHGPLIGDFMHEVSPDGKVVWEWYGAEQMDPSIDVLCPLDARHEWTHQNAAEEMPDGNLLVSFRQPSTIAIIHRSSGQVLWRFGPGVLSHQHDPTVLANGNLLIFDNGEHRIGDGTYSRVVEIKPGTGEIVWQYVGTPRLAFYSTGISGAQRLPNGNTLICEGRTGRIFEVTMDGEIVWEFINPFDVVHRGEPGSRAVFRAHRYAADSPEIRNRV